MQTDMLLVAYSFYTNENIYTRVYTQGLFTRFVLKYVYVRVQKYSSIFIFIQIAYRNIWLQRHVCCSVAMKGIQRSFLANICFCAVLRIHVLYSLNANPRSCPRTKIDTVFFRYVYLFLYLYTCLYISN